MIMILIRMTFMLSITACDSTVF